MENGEPGTPEQATIRAVGSGTAGHNSGSTGTCLALPASQVCEMGMQDGRLQAGAVSVRAELSRVAPSCFYSNCTSATAGAPG